MNLFRIFLICFCFHVQVFSSGDDIQGFFSLKNGDVLKGNQVNLRGDAFEFFARSFDARLTLEPEDLSAWQAAGLQPLRGDSLSRVQLIGGEGLDVRVLGLDDAWLYVETAWGQRSAIRVADLARISLPEATGPLYHGPQPLSGFQIPNAPDGTVPGWVEVAGGISSFSGPRAALPLNLPDTDPVFRLSMTVRSRGETNLALDLEGSGSRATGPNRISIRQRQNQLTVNSYTRIGSLTAGARTLPEDRLETYHLEFYVNPRENHYVLRWNGVPVWEGREAPADSSESFSFERLRIQFIGNAPVLIQELRLSSWNGHPPRESEAPASGVRVIFRNQDGLTASSVRMRDDAWVLSPGEEAELTLPFDRIAELVFPAPAGGDSGPPRFDAELRFAFPGNRLRVTDLQLSGGAVSAHHPAFRDPLSVPLRTVQGIEWRGTEPLPPVTDAGTATLRLLSGEILRGTLEGFADDRLKFRPAWRDTPLTVPLAAVDTLSPAGEDVLTDSPHRFRLMNRDTFRGTLQAVSERDVSVLAPWGDVLRVARGGLTEISAMDGEPGDWIDRWGSDADWRMTRGWRPNPPPPDPDGPSVARGGMIYARRLPDSPDKVMLDLPLEANASVGLLFNLYAAGPERGRPLEGVEVNVTSRQILARVSGGAEWVNYERIPVAPNRLQFFFDPEADTISIFLNGEEIPSINLPLPKGLENRWMWFQSIGNNFSTAGLQVHPWSGKPDPEMRRMKARALDEILMAGAPPLRGRLLPDAPGRLAFLPEGAHEALTFPVRELQRLRFQADTQYESRSKAGDVQVLFRGGGSFLTLTWLKGDGDTIVGNGEAWRDPVSIPLRFVETILFNEP
ncbi:MAG: hypothetical protein JJU05_09475 [Verrucomicrobia bacterium]|nr:hypothetical protein [Verrucomicrobiota bacterium]MCH8526018.1 hypothetical protein [Kiritimatiellia bacterium]